MEERGLIWSRPFSTDPAKPGFVFLAAMRSGVMHGA